MEIITQAGESLIALKQAEAETLVIDTFILANIQEQDHTIAIDRNRGLPEQDTIVYQAPVTSANYIENNSVVYSLFMSADIGPFSFNTIYLVCGQDSSTVFAISTLPVVSKIANDIANGIRGTSMTRNFVITFEGAQGITNITVPANAWQFDITEATETKKGLIQIATQSEVDEGTDNFKSVTSQKLKQRIDYARHWNNITNKPDTFSPSVHTHDYTELTGFGSAAPLDAGESSGQVAKIGDPAITGNTAVVVNSGSNAYGWWRRWSDGSIEQWGKATFPYETDNHVLYVTLPVPMSNTDYLVLVTSFGDDTGEGGEVHTGIQSRYTTQISIHAIRHYGNGIGQHVFAHWYIKS